MSQFPVFGFPSPAADYDNPVPLSLDRLLVAKPAATQYLRAASDNLRRYGIRRGDLLIMERGLEPKHRDLVVAVVDGEYRVGFLDHQGEDGHRLWTPEQSDPISEVEGVITASVRLWHRPPELPAV